VTFYGIPCSGFAECSPATTSVYATQYAFANSSSNIVSLFNNSSSSFAPGAFDVRSGSIEADFATGQHTVSIMANALSPLEGAFGAAGNQPYLKAYYSATDFSDVGYAYYGLSPYQAGGTCFDSTSGQLSACAGGWQQLSITAPAGKSILAIRFSSTYNGTSSPMYGRFDDLTFSDATNGGPGPGPVPEPGTLLLMGTGLAVIARKFGRN
jgi:hypothetical protein